MRQMNASNTITEKGERTMKNITELIPVRSCKKVHDTDDFDAMVRIVNRHQNEMKEQKERTRRRRKELLFRYVGMALDAAIFAFSIIGLATVIAFIFMM